MRCTAEFAGKELKTWELLEPYMSSRIHGLFIVMVIALLGLLAIVVVQDIIQSQMNNRPMSYSVINLIKLAIAGVLGAIAGYLAKQDKSTDEED